MTDDDLIDAFHKAIEEHEAAKAGKGDYDETYKAVAAIEKATAAWFGIGENWKRYRARYPRPD
jgi:hypothetical protein